MRIDNVIMLITTKMSYYVSHRHIFITNISCTYTVFYIFEKIKKMYYITYVCILHIITLL